MNEHYSCTTPDNCILCTLLNLWICFPADKGIMGMIVFGGLNDELKLSPYRPYNCSIRGRFKKTNGSFVYCNREVRLKDGDVCVYHLIAAKDYYLGFCGKYGLRFTVNIHRNKKYRIFHDLDDGADTT